MGMIAAGAVEPAQLGAWLMLMRYRGESAEELAGMCEALRETFAPPPAIPGPVLDWPAYAAGRTRGLPWFVLAARLLAANGVAVLMHGPFGGTAPLPERAASLIGVPLAPSLAAVPELLASARMAYIRLPDFCPVLQSLLDLRRVLGLRSPANTVARLLNPLGAACQIQGVFHPAYRPLQQAAARLLGQPRFGVLKGGGGEAERNPDKPCQVFVLRDGATGEEDWPALVDGSSAAFEPPADVALLPALWRGEYRDPHAVATVTGSAAVALSLLGRATNSSDADSQVQRLWETRPAL